MLMGIRYYTTLPDIGYHFITQLQVNTKELLLCFRLWTYNIMNWLLFQKRHKCDIFQVF